MPHLNQTKESGKKGHFQCAYMWYDLSYTEFSIEILFLPAIKWYSCFSSILLELIKCSWKKKWK